MRHFYMAHVCTPPGPVFRLPGCLPDNSRMSPQDPSEISRMRISDADRDRAASVLSQALAEGRLTPEEHSERLDAIYAAKTQAEITPVVSDLPGAAAALASPEGTLATPSAGETGVASRNPARLAAVFGGITRKGAWRVPQELEAVTIFGGADLDLRDAILPGREIHIRAICVLGGVDIKVPPEMHVIDDGWAVMGGREIPPDSPESNSPDAPVLRLSGLSVLGGLTVKRKRRKADPAARSLPRLWRACVLAANLSE